MNGKRPARALLAALLCLLYAVPRANSAIVLEDQLTMSAAQDRHAFDGSVVPKAGGAAEAVAEGEGGGEEKPLAKAAALAQKEREPAVPKPAPDGKPQSKLERFEERLYKGSFWAYHVSWAVDTFMTGWGISHGLGFEADKLYTRFGNKNVLGVVGSLAAGHAIVTAAAMFLHKKAEKRHGWKRHLLMGAAIGMCVFGTVEHIYGAKSWVPLL